MGTAMPAAVAQTLLSTGHVRSAQPTNGIDSQSSQSPQPVQQEALRSQPQLVQPQEALLQQPPKLFRSPALFEQNNLLSEVQPPFASDQQRSSQAARQLWQPPLFKQLSRPTQSETQPQAQPNRQQFSSLQLPPALELLPLSQPTPAMFKSQAWQRDRETWCKQAEQTHQKHSPQRKPCMSFDASFLGVNAASMPLRQLPAIKLSKRPSQQVQQECRPAALPAPFEQLQASPHQSAATSPCNHVSSECNIELDAEPDAAHEAAELPSDLSDSLFMRVFRAHGGCDKIQSLTEPLGMSGPKDREQTSEDVTIKADWQEMGVRARCGSTPDRERAYIQELGLKHPPPADLPQPDAQRQAGGHDKHNVLTQQQPVPPPYARSMQPISLGQRPRPGSISLGQPSRRSNMTRTWSGPATHSAPGPRASSVHDSYKYDRQNTFGHSQSPQPRPESRHQRSARLDSPAASGSPSSDAHGFFWDANNCALCNSQPADLGSKNCRCAL
jgi:hypothetical protein